MQLKVKQIIRRGIGYLKRNRLQKDFAELGRTSGFGKNCALVGCNHMYIGNECAIGDGSEIICLDSHFGQKLSAALKIGNHVRMTARCRITCAGNITIGNDVLMAPEVFITDHNHGMDPTYPGGYSPQPLNVKDISIGDGAWLGQRVCVLPGVTVGAHSIIGAGSVVTHSVPDYCMAAGNPAKVIKKWNNDRKQWELV